MSGSNQSSKILILGNIRIAGARDDRFPGMGFGGYYTPAHQNETGKAVPAKFTCSAYINNGTYKDAQGVKKERKSTVVDLTFWNGTAAEGGKGMADLAAKTLSVGKQLSVFCIPESYKGRVYIDRQPRNKADGSEAKTDKIGFKVMSGHFDLGDDGEKWLDFEYANWKAQPGQVNFFSRPAGWRGAKPYMTPEMAAQANADKAQWEGLSEARQASS